MPVSYDRDTAAFEEAIQDAYQSTLDSGNPDWRFDPNAYGGENSQLQHVIPLNVVKNNADFFNELEANGAGSFDANDANNGVYLPGSEEAQRAGLEYEDGPRAGAMHRGDHIPYNDYMTDELGRIEVDYRTAISGIPDGPDGDIARQNAATSAMNQVRNLQRDAIDAQANNDPNRVRMFMNRFDEVMNDRLESQGRDRVDGPLNGRKATDVMNEAIYDDVRNDSSILRRTRNGGLISTAFVTNPDGSVSQVNNFNGQTRTNIRNFIDAKVSGAMGSAATIIAGASILKMIADYLGEEEISVEQAVEFLKNSNIDIDEQVIRDTLQGVAFEAAISIVARAVGGPIALAYSAYELYENYGALRDSLKLAETAFDDLELIKNINRNLDSAESYIGNFFDDNEDSSAANNQVGGQLDINIETGDVSISAELNQTHFDTDGLINFNSLVNESSLPSDPITPPDFDQLPSTNDFLNTLSVDWPFDVYPDDLGDVATPGNMVTGTIEPNTVFTEQRYDYTTNTLTLVSTTYLGGGKFSQSRREWANLDAVGLEIPTLTDTQLNSPDFTEIKEGIVQTGASAPLSLSLNGVNANGVISYIPTQSTITQNINGETVERSRSYDRDISDGSAVINDVTRYQDGSSVSETYIAELDEATGQVNNTFIRTSLDGEGNGEEAAIEYRTDENGNTVPGTKSARSGSIADGQYSTTASFIDDGNGSLVAPGSVEELVNSSTSPFGVRIGDDIVFANDYDPVDDLESAGRSDFSYLYRDGGDIFIVDQTFYIEEEEVILEDGTVTTNTNVVTTATIRNITEVGVLPSSMTYQVTSSVTDEDESPSHNLDYLQTRSNGETHVIDVSSPTEEFQPEAWAAGLAKSNPYLGALIGENANLYGNVSVDQRQIEVDGETQIVDVTSFSLRNGDDITSVQMVNGEVIQRTTRSGGLTISLNNGRVDVKYTFENGQGVLDVGSIGSTLGSTLGNTIVGENASLFVSSVSSTLFSAIGENIADSLAIATTEATLGQATEDAFSDFGLDLQDAAVGTVSSLIAAELVESIGVEGLGGQFLTTIGGAAVNEALDIALSGGDYADFSVDFNQVAANFVYTYIGKEIGKQVYEVETKDGAIGASAGAAIGAKIGTAIYPGIGTIIGAALGYVFGGIIGDLFGGTPRSWADVVYNHSTDAFEVTNVRSKDDGNKGAARSLASSAADILNGIIENTGSEVLNEGVVYGGTYGLRKKAFTFQSQDGEPQRRFADAKDAIALGVLNSLDELKLAGGNVYVKRALYRVTESLLDQVGTEEVSLRLFGRSERTYHVFAVPDNALETLTGALAVGNDYAKYRAFEDEINAIITVKPDSAFAAAWIATLAQAKDFGLVARHESDHFGGWQQVMHEARTDGDTSVGDSEQDALGVNTILSFDFDDNERVIQITRADGSVVFVEDLLPGSLKDEIDFTDQSSLDIAFQNVDVAAVIQGSSGADTIVGNDLGNDIFGGLGNDTITGGQLADWIVGGEGNDTLNAGGGNNNALFGGSGNDELQGAEGSDWLEGGEGDDTLLGYSGSDYLQGNEGDDTVEGGAGNDVYIFRRNDGHDTLIENFNESSEAQNAYSDLSGLNAWDSGRRGGEIKGGIDTIEFGEGIGLEHIYIQRDGSDLVITLLDEQGQLPTDPVDQLRLSNWDDQFSRIEKLKFVDGQVIDLGNFESFIVGTGDADTIIGTNGNDFIHGGSGDDEINALLGDDVAIGGLGNDIVSGNEDNDLVIGGDGFDNLFGNEGNDVVSGDRGNDILRGGDGDDVLSGGEGDDEIYTGSGNDTVVFGHGDGHDNLIDAQQTSGDVSVLAWSVSGGYANGYTESDLFETFQVSTDFGVIPVSRLRVGFYRDSSFDEFGDSIVALVNNSTESGLLDLGEDTLEFKMDVAIGDIHLRRNGDDLELLVQDTGNPLETLDQISDAVNIVDWYGPTGRSIETFRLYGLPDIEASSFTGWLGGTDSDDVLQGDSGRDWITGGLGQDELIGGAGDDIISGGADDDLIEGGAGSDRLIGGIGEDTLDYSNSASGVQVDLTVEEQSGGDAAGDLIDGFENVIGSNFSDYIRGDDESNEIDGNGGSDTIVGAGGDDIYIYNVGDGHLTVIEGDDAIGAIGEGEDVIQFGDGIDPGDLNFEKSGFDLNIFINGTEDQITLKNWFFSTGQKVEILRFISGGSIDISDQVFSPVTSDAADWIGGDDSANQLNGGLGNDVLSGRGGSDNIFGGEGDDLILGGLGADNLDGGEGYDSVAYYDSAEGVTVYLDNSVASTGGTAEGDSFTSVEDIIGSEFDDTLSGTISGNVIDGGRGNDTILGGDGADLLQGGAGDDLILGGAGQDEITGDAGNDEIYGGSFDDQIFGGDGDDRLYGDQGKDFIDGGDGINTIFGGADDDTIQGGYQNEFLYGDSGSDSIRAGDGNDYVSGGAGKDRLFGGEGNDEIDGNSGEDSLSGGTGDDILRGGSDDDVIQGDDGRDVIEGGSGNDVLSGGAGDDLVVGGEGSDFIIGDDGDDILMGGEDTDFYVFSGDFGQDKVIEAADRQALDEIIFTDVGLDQLWFTEDGDDLVISVIGTDNFIRIENFSRFRINSDVSGELLAQLEEAFQNLAPIESLRVDNQVLSLQAINQLVEEMSGLDIPASMNEVPPRIHDLQISLPEEGEVTALESRVQYAPEMLNRDFSIVEGENLNGTLLATDRNPDEFLSYEIVRGPSVGEFLLDTATGEFSFSAPEEFSGEIKVKVRVVDSAGLQDDATLTIRVSPVDDAASIEANSTLITTEDSPGLGNLKFIDSDNVFGDYDAEYTATKGVVEFLSDGRFLYKPFENAEGNDTVNITLTDRSGRTYNSVVAVTILGENDKPVAASSASSPIQYQVSNSATIVGQIPFFDPDVGDSHTFELVTPIEGNLVINANGTFSYTVGDNFDGEDAFAIRVRDDSGDPLSYDDVYYEVLDNAPIFSGGNFEFFVDENSGPQPLGFVIANDPDGDTVNYRLSNDFGGLFEITQSGQVFATSSLDFEQQSRYELTVIADMAGANAEQAIVINVVDQSENSQPNILVFNPSDNLSIDEGLPVGTVVGTVSASDLDGNLDRVELLSSTAPFALGNEIGGGSSNDLVYEIVTTSTLDYDTAIRKLFEMQAVATDAEGLSRSGSFTIELRNVNDEAPVVTTTKNASGEIDFSLAENSAIGTVIGSVEVTDVDPNDSLSYELLGADSTRYSLNAQGNVVQILSNSSVNHETNDFDSFTLSISDGVNTTTQEINVYISDVDEAPTNVQWANGQPSISETLAAGQRVGLITVTDPDEPAEFRDWVYSMDGNDANGRFNINAATGEITVDGSTQLDVGPEGGNYTVTVRVSNKNDANQFFEKDLDISVTNAASDPVVIVDNTTVNIAEFSAWRPQFGGSTSVVFQGQTYSEATPGDIVLSETQLSTLFSADEGSILTYKIESGNVQGAFNIEGNRLVVSTFNPYIGTARFIDGELVETSGAEFLSRENELTGGVYNLKISATDENGNKSTSDAQVTINLLDIEERETIFDVQSDGFTPIVSPRYSVFHFSSQSLIRDIIRNSDGTVIARNPRNVNNPPDRLWQTIHYVGDYIQYAPRADGAGNPIFLGEHEYEAELRLANVTGGANGIVFATYDAPLKLNWDTLFYNSAFKITPVILDLDGDGLTWSQQVNFDVDNDGVEESLPWGSSTDGILALDRNNDGVISRGIEISFTADYPGANTDLEGLVAYDTNSDGFLSAGDDQFSDFIVWKDVNVNGISEVGELFGLAELGIESIALQPILSSEETGVDGIELHNTSYFSKTNGDQFLVGDVSLTYTEIDFSSARAKPVSFGTEDSNTLLGSLGADHFDAAGGNDLMFGREGDDLIFGGSGDDYLSGEEGNDELYGGVGNDDLYGGIGDDQIHGEDGQDVLSGGDGNDILKGGNQNDLLYGDAGNDVLYGEDGDDTLLGGDGDDFLDGGDDRDELYGGTGSDVLEGGSEDDALFGGDGNDSLSGGFGNDLIDGGAGENAIWYSPENGIDVVSATGGTYVLNLLGFVPLDLKFYEEDGVLVLALENDGSTDAQQIQFKGYEPDGLFEGAGALSLTGVNFYDEYGFPIEEWNREILLSKIYDQFNPIIEGTEFEDEISGTGERDLIEAQGGNDVVASMGGNDEVYAADGHDIVLGGDGNDFVDGGKGDDILYGDRGDDELYGNAGSDILDGGDGVDQLYGGEGVDSLDGGDGDDLLYGEAGSDALVGGLGNDVLDGGSEDDELHGGLGDDELYGSHGSDLLYGDDGDDYLEGGEGNDQLFGGEGSDIINAGEGNDSVYGGAGVDILIGEDGSDTLRGEDGDDALFGDAGDDTLVGGDGDDILSGGEGTDFYRGDKGNDLIKGGEGTNIIQFTRGDGVDTVVHIEGNLDSYRLGFIDINPSHITLKKFVDSRSPESVNDDVVTFELDLSFGDKIIFEGYNFYDPSQSPIEEIYFGYIDDDGTAKTTTFAGSSLVDLLSSAIIRGTANDDVIWGSSSDDIIYGLEGSDLLNGGQGADVLIGGEGDDTYVLDTAQDQVIEQSLQGLDWIYSTVSGSLSDNVENFTLLENSEGHALEAIGNELDNQIVGNSEDNLLVGNLGNDTLVGGEGADQLVGGDGDDVYHVDNVGDQVIEYAGAMFKAIENGSRVLIEAEDYDAFYDTTPGNQGGAYRFDDVDITATSDSSGGYNIGWIESGEWLEYQIEIPNDGVYTANIRLASQDFGGEFILEVDGEPVGTSLNVGTTGSWNTWETRSIDIGSLTAGSHTLRMSATGSPFNLNWIELEQTGEEVLADTAGTDSVVSSIDYSLGSNVENLQLIKNALSGQGNELDNHIVGNELDNQLLGYEGDDILDGGIGADQMAGGDGNDIYIVDNVDDQVIESIPVEDAVLASDIRIRIEAENYHRYWDASAGNIGNDYRFDDVDIGWAYDEDNTFSVGWTESGEWAEHDIYVDYAGNYKLDVRVASQDPGGKFAIMIDGNAKTDLEVGATGGWNAWKTETLDLGHLSEGHHVLRVQTDQGPFNLNWLELNAYSLDELATAKASGIDTIYSSVNYTLGDNVENLVLTGNALEGYGNELSNQLTGNELDNHLVGGDGNDQLDGAAGADLLVGGQGDDVYFVDHIGDLVVEDASTSRSKQASQNIHVRVEAENYDRYYDTTSGNTGGDYANDDVDIGWAGDEEGGFYSLGWIDANEWLEYDIVIPESGDYGVDARLASEQWGGQFTLQIDGQNVGPYFNVNATGGWEEWATQSGNLGHLDAGHHTLRIQVHNGPFNLNWLDFKLNTPLLEDNGTSSIRIEAEDYNSYYDTTPGNIGNAYRFDDVDISVTGDINGGYNIGWVTEGEWLEYNFSVEETSQFVADFRLASQENTGEFAVQVDGITVATHFVGSTGGWSNWETHQVELGEISQGSHTLRILAIDSPYNLNWIDLKATETVPESDNPGNDTVYSSIDYALTANVENLVLIGDAQQGIGNALDNYMKGNELDNVLSGGEGNDVLDGGKGDDAFFGGSGYDIIKFSRGDGQDIVKKSSGYYFIDLNQISASEAQWVTTDNQLELDLGEGDKLIFEGFDSSDSERTLNIFEIRFNHDGTQDIWEREKISDEIESAFADVVGTSGDENWSLGGNGLNQRIALLGGDDQLTTQGDASTIHAGYGNDWVSAGGGDDKIFGGAGMDIIYGGDGNDVLSGGWGYDLLKGGNGDDEYLFNIGDGKDVIDDLSGINHVVFGVGVDYESVVTEKRGSHLAIQYGEQGDEIVINWQFDGQSSPTTDFTFAEGIVVNMSTLLTDKPYSINGSAFRDQLSGTGGNDLIRAGAENDTVAGGDGDDQIWGENGDDTLNGGSGNDVLNGGQGNDTLIGGSGSNLYTFDFKDGQDVIRNSAGDNILQFAEDFDIEQIWFERENDDLKISILGGDENITVDDWYLSSDAKLDEITVGDLSLTEDAVEQLVQFMAGFGSPTGGDINLSSDQQQQVLDVIASNWM